FCYYCGLLGHTEDSCDKLYSVKVDDDIREWGPELRPEVRWRGQETSSRWLRDDEQVRWQTPNQERDTSINEAITEIRGDISTKFIVIVTLAYS
ncbi:hypothetical protein A2U01_0075257, partial [Trifolium medium]|nr:hypothetical protein [Trifolium medium]